MWIAISIIAIFCLACIFSVYRMNFYIISLEKSILKQIELTENLKQSLKEIIADDFLENDGRLKKYRIQNEKNFIYNGQSLDETDFEI